MKDLQTEADAQAQYDADRNAAIHEAIHTISTPWLWPWDRKHVAALRAKLTK